MSPNLWRPTAARLHLALHVNAAPPMDLKSLDKWDAYTTAKEEMFLRTDTDRAPWTTIKSNDKSARINAMRHYLSRFDYAGNDAALSVNPTPSSSSAASRQ